MDDRVIWIFFSATEINHPHLPSLGPKFETNDYRPLGWCLETGFFAKRLVIHWGIHKLIQNYGRKLRPATKTQCQPAKTRTKLKLNGMKLNDCHWKSNEPIENHHRIATNYRRHIVMDCKRHHVHSLLFTFPLDPHSELLFASRCNAWTVTYYILARNVFFL